MNWSNEIQQSPVITRSKLSRYYTRYCDDRSRTQADFKLNTDTPYHGPTGELMSVYYENFDENWPRYNGATLYVVNNGEDLRHEDVRKCSACVGNSQIPPTKGPLYEWGFDVSLFLVWTSCWTSNRIVCNLRCHWPHAKFLKWFKILR